MDEVASKLKGLWRKKGKKGFKGSGHVLGSAPEKAAPASSRAPERPLGQRSRPSPSPQSAQAPGGVQSAATPSTSTMSPSARGTRLGSAPTVPDTRSQPAAQPAIRYSPPQEHSREADVLPSATSAPSDEPSTSSDAQYASDDVQDAVALLRCDDRPGAPAISILTRLLRNIANSPQDAKFRRLRLQNPKIKDAVVEIAGGIELLQACGFDLVFESVEEGLPEEGFAILPEDADVDVVRNALYLISPNEPRPVPPRDTFHSLPATTQSSSASAASSSGAGPSSSTAAPPAPSGASAGTSTSTPAAAASSAPAAAPVQPRPRNTQVLIPTDSESSVPDWVFERSPAELKQALMLANRRREQGEVLMTRAMKEKLAVGDRRPAPSWGTIRVRMPEGLLLQGEFAAGESCTAVFAWLTDCLQDPGETYRLVQPRAGALEAGKRTLRDAGLLPSVLLHFQREGRARDRTPALSPQLLSQAKPAS